MHKVEELPEAAIGSQTKFRVIPDEQTPAVMLPDDYDDSDVPDYINLHKEQMLGLMDFAKKTPYAVGLAANQCELDGKRMMVRAFCYKNPATGWQIVFCPEVIDYLGKRKLCYEGCLTWGEKKRVKVWRHQMVKVRFFDIDGAVYNRTLAGDVAQIFQHEIDHLNGKHEWVVDVALEVMKLKAKQEKNKPVAPIRVASFPGRNDLCTCGSGVKYKKCCGK